MQLKTKLRQLEEAERLHRRTQLGMKATTDEVTERVELDAENKKGV